MVFDAQNDGKIDQKNEIVFTEWDKSAKSDMQALRDVFDTDHNGKLNGATDLNGNGKIDVGEEGDAQFSQFKVWVTNADGTRTLQTLAAVGIASINLIENEVEITLPDGSKITGQTTYDKVGGGTGTAATVSLATETQGYALDRTVTTSGTVKTIDTKQRNADGSIAGETQSKYNSSTQLDTTSFDYDGDGVWDRVQNTSRSTPGTVVVANRTTAGVLIDRTKTETSSSTVTISRDLQGYGFYSQVETQVTGLDGHITIIITDKNADGTTFDQTTRDTSVDAPSGEILSRIETIDLNFDGVIDWTESDDTVINANKSRTETVIDSAGTTEVSRTVTLTSADGQTKTITADLDGDEDTDLTSVNDITSSTVSHITTSVTLMTDTAGDGTTLIRKTRIDELADASGNDYLSTQVDRDGDGTYDLKTDDNTTVSAGYRTQVVQHIAGNGSTLLDKITTKKYDDSRTRDVTLDDDGDGYKDQTESITISSGTSTRVLTNWVSSSSPTPTMIDQVTTTTTADGLTVTTEIDADGNGVYDTKIWDQTVITAGVSTKETITTTNKESDSLRTNKTVTTTADGLSITTTLDLNGDTHDDLKTTDVTEIRAGHTTDYQVRTIINYNKDDTTRDRSVTTTSLDRRTITINTDLNYDKCDDTVENITIGNDGTLVDETSHYLGTSLKYQTVVTTTDDKLKIVTDQDFDGNGIFDLRTTDETVLHASGGKTETISNTVGATLFNKTTILISANSLSKTTSIDVDGNTTTDVTIADNTVLNSDGSRTETITRSNAAGLIDKTIATVSGNELRTTIRSDLDGDGTFETTLTEGLTYGLDGTTTETLTTTNADLSLRAQVKTITSADRKSVTVTRAEGGSSVQTDTSAEKANGDTIETIENFTPLGVALTSYAITTSANGLSRTVVTTDAAGTIIDTLTDAIVLKDTGSRVETWTESGVGGAAVATIVETTNDDGLSVQRQITLNGLNTLMLNTDDTTILKDDGSREEKITATDAYGTYITTITTTDDGLSATMAVNLNNSGTDEITKSRVVGADGSKSVTENHYSTTTTGTLLWGRSVTVDASGRTSTTKVDRDGAGGVDWTETVTHNADGSTTDAIVGLSAFGALAFQKSTTTIMNTAGGMKSTTIDKDATTTLDKTTVEVSANGLLTTTLYDTNADSKVDLTKTDVTTLIADGSTVKREVTRYAGGLLGSEIDTVTSADGRTVSKSIDNDGNGVVERLFVQVTQVDGSRTNTQADYNNKTGQQVSQKTFYTSANGLVSTVSGVVADPASGGVWDYTDTTTTFAAANGSYQWVRIVGDMTVASTSHVIDANGIDTWRWSVPNDVAWNSGTGGNNVPAPPVSGTVRIDVETERKYLDVARRMYAAALDRDMLDDETEMLAQYVSSANGGLNRTQLATNIVTSREFTERYGSIPLATFVNDAFMNVFGHLPSATIRGQLATITTLPAALIAIGEMSTSGQVIRSDIHDGIAWGTVSYANSAGGVSAYINAPSSNTGAAVGDTYFQISNLIGSASADTLSGDDNDNVFVGGVGADKLIGGSGNDTASYAGSSSAVSVDLSGTIPGASGGDAQGDAFTSIENITGSDFADTLSGDSNANVLEGGVLGDKLDGGAGIDTASYANSPTSDPTSLLGVTVSLVSGATNTGADAAGDVLLNIENVIGSGFDDTLTGDNNDNTLSGGGGDDLLSGGGGADQFIGGSGNDTVSYAAAASRVAASLDPDSTGGTAGEGAGDKFASVENVVGSAYDDTFFGTDAGNRMQGAAGGDALFGGAGNDIYVFGRGDGHDEITDSDREWAAVESKEYLTRLIHYAYFNPYGDDTHTSINIQDYDLTTTPTEFHNDAGRDTIEFGAGIAISDLVLELRGADLYVGLNDPANPGSKASALVDSIRLANWVDPKDRIETFKFADGSTADVASLVGGSIEPTSYNPVAGTSSSDTLDGTVAADKLTGGAGHDSLNGGLGDDRLEGDAGNDTYKFGRGSGWDTVRDESFTTSAAVTYFGGYVVQPGWQYYYWDYTPRKYTTYTRTQDDAGSDTLSFDSGISIEDIAAATTGNDLVIALRNPASPDVKFWALSDQVRIENWVDAKDRIETLKFFDGMQVDVSQMLFAASGDSGDDALTGDATMNWLSGGAGNDALFGIGGNDILVGGGGNDVLTGGAGADKLYGGAGADTADYSGSTSVNINLLAGTVAGGDAAGDTFNSIENVTGSSLDDTLIGDDGANVLKGGLGADTLDGKGGSDTADYSDSTAAVSANLTTGLVSGGTAAGDTLINIENVIGGAGNDKLTGTDGGGNRLDGGAGQDTLTGGDGNDIYVVDDLGDVIVEKSGEGTDTVISSVSWSIANTPLENITLIGTASVNAIGNATLNTLRGNSGNNSLNGGAGADTMIGGAGNDTYYVENANDKVTEQQDEGIDKVNSSITLSLGLSAWQWVEDLTLTGTSAINGSGNALDNSITGNAQVNVLTGAVGNDILEGGGGADILDGSDGDDTASYSASAASVTVNLATNTNTNGDAQGDTITNVENLTGSAYDDTLTGDSGANVLDGGTGNDALIGGAGNDTYVVDNTGDVITENSASGTDTVLSSVTWTLGEDFENLTLTGSGAINGTGNSSNNTLTGNSANNALDGDTGNDTLIGGRGNDTYVVDSTGDVIVENAGEGIDLVRTSVSLSLQNFANVENAAITSLGGRSLTGNDLSNSLSGHTGSDSLIGGAGDDWLTGNLGDDKLNGGDGLDTAAYTYSGSGVSVNLMTGTGSWGEAQGDTFNSIENLTGSSNNDSLTGDGNNNVLNGAAGNDTLDGGAGDDALTGGVGNDTLTGGDGVDLYFMSRGDKADIIQNADADGGFDTLKFDTGIARDQLWFVQSGNDLLVSIIGTSDSAKVQGWYSAAANQIDKLQISDGHYLNVADVESLRSAMSAFSPPPLGQTSLDSTRASALAPTLAASWH